MQSTQEVKQKLQEVIKSGSLKLNKRQSGILEHNLKPILHSVLKQCGADCVVFNYLVENKLDLSRPMVTEFHVFRSNLEEKYYSASLPKQTKLKPAVPNPMASWGRKSFPNGYSLEYINSDETAAKEVSAVIESTNDDLFDGWIREKAWFPISLTFEGVEKFALVCLIRGEVDPNKKDDACTLSSHEITDLFKSEEKILTEVYKKENLSFPNKNDFFSADELKILDEFNKSEEALIQTKSDFSEETLQAKEAVSSQPLPF